LSLDGHSLKFASEICNLLPGFGESLQTNLNVDWREIPLKNGKLLPNFGDALYPDLDINGRDLALKTLELLPE
jgi:hypothetical protein